MDNCVPTAKCSRQSWPLDLVYSRLPASFEYTDAREIGQVSGYRRYGLNTLEKAVPTRISKSIVDIDRAGRRQVARLTDSTRLDVRCVTVHYLVVVVDQHVGSQT
jgi:hypothetical protein